MLKINHLKLNSNQMLTFNRHTAERPYQPPKIVILPPAVKFATNETLTNFKRWGLSRGNLHTVTYRRVDEDNRKNGTHRQYNRRTRVNILMEGDVKSGKATEDANHRRNQNHGVHPFRQQAGCRGRGDE